MRLLAIAVLAACGTQPPPATSRTMRWTPIVDSHVHLAYWPVADQLADRGIAAVIDLGSPAIVTSDALTVISAGPMLTRPDGYPLDSWGADGYGIGCADAACFDRWAHGGVVKIALDDGGLDPALLVPAIAVAHAKGAKVAVHALTDRAALLAAQAGADLLAHTPVEPLRPETIEAWRGRAVISTLAAFGGRPAAVANLRALRAAGVTVLYGTDLGNLRDAGPSEREVALLREAGLDDAAIVAAMTTEPVRYWNLQLGESFLVLDTDPRRDVRELFAPREVWIGGRRRM